MEKLSVLMIDVATGETSERDFNAEEIANYEAMQLQQQISNNEMEAKAEARESALSKLAALGLTQEEIEAL
jgi:hypothetical protein